jgi:MoaA/NifB/PqqE/SkfB family radical SAM enzyme
MKAVRTPTYKYNFNENTGYFERWGKNKNDDPQYSPIGPEILDIEVSTICHQGCKFCYKSNTGHGTNMSFETLKYIIDKMPTLTQIAFGIGDIDTNPDLFRMFDYCRETGIVPNVTVNGFRLTDDHITKLSKYCGAVAVSNYQKDTCYNTVQRLINVGMTQVNIHQLMAQESYGQIWDLIHDFKNDERLKKLNAIVFLSLKKKGRGYGYNRMPDNKFAEIVNYCLENGIRFGFDSCTACKFLKAIENRSNYSKIAQYAEPCESGLFSAYINTEGIFHPCSFAEGFGYDLDVVKCEDFLQDIWYHPITIQWRKRLIENKRECPLYDV